MTIFEKFNEMIFESYCKKSISNAIKKERHKKATRGQIEQPLSALTDAVLYALSKEMRVCIRPMNRARFFI